VGLQDVFLRTMTATGTALAHQVMEEPARELKEPPLLREQYDAVEGVPQLGEKMGQDESTRRIRCCQG